MGEKFGCIVVKKLFNDYFFVEEKKLKGEEKTNVNYIYKILVNNSPENLKFIPLKFKQISA
jgi:hypothetical protein